MALLKAALALVEGQVGADAPARQFSWLVDDQAVYGRVECWLLDAANRLGELALEIEQPDVANWSAGVGLAVVPGCEAMFRLQMRAASIEGSSRGVHEAFSAAEKATARLGPWAEVDTATYDWLTALTGHDDAQAS